MCKQQDINLYATSEDVPVPLDEATMLKQMRKQMSQDIEYLLSEGLIDPKLFEKPIIGEDGNQTIMFPLFITAWIVSSLTVLTVLTRFMSL